MEVKPKMRKFIGTIPEEEMKLIEQACEIEKRSFKIGLIRRGAVEYAKKIIIENKENKK